MTLFFSKTLLKEDGYTVNYIIYIKYIVNVSKIEQFYASSNSLKTASDATSICFGPEMKRKNLCNIKNQNSIIIIYIISLQHLSSCSNWSGVNLTPLRMSLVWCKTQIYETKYTRTPLDISP